LRDRIDRRDLIQIWKTFGADEPAGAEFEFCHLAAHRTLTLDDPARLRGIVGRRFSIGKSSAHVPVAVPRT
jgi:hypothetical protein